MTILPAVLVLSGCLAFHGAPRSGPRPRSYPAAHDVVAGGKANRFDDAPLSVLVGSAVVSVPAASTGALSAAIAHRYVALRAAQSALVLLAEREALDRRSLTGIRPRPAGDAAPGQGAMAEAILRHTHEEQGRVRVGIARLRERLAVLTGLAPGLIDGLPGGPIPLPPVLPPAGAHAPAIGPRDAAPLGRYAAARIAARAAQATAEQAGALAAMQRIRLRLGSVAPGDVLRADREALSALQAEQQARAVMTQDYVTLTAASHDDETPPR